MRLLNCARGHLLAAATSLGLTLLTPAAAHAVGDLKIDVPGNSDGFVSGTVAPGLVFDDLMPGEQRSATIGLWNDSAEPVSLRMHVSDLVDGENGCVEPESNDGGDTSCAVGGGELSRWLELSVTRTDGSADQHLWSGPFTAMTTGTVLAETMPAGEQWDLRIDVLMRPEAGNVTMTDAVQFVMAWSSRGQEVGPPGGDPDRPGPGPEQEEPVTMPGDEPVEDEVILGEEQTGGDVQVAGVAGSAADGEVLGAQRIALPLTGAAVEPWLLVYAGVLIGGGALLLARSQRQAAVVRARQGVPT